jgi:hypothetical protein
MRQTILNHTTLRGSNLPLAVRVKRAAADYRKDLPVTGEAHGV